MHTVTVIGFDGALASAITGMIDLLRLAGVTWARIRGEEPKPLFHTRLVTANGEPCRCINGLTLAADGNWADIPPSDVVIVPTIGGPIEKILAENHALAGWLAQQPRHGTLMASNCTGAFLLAESGLLDNREATTHWGYSDQFRRRYPAILCRPEKLITVDGPIACAGGGVAWWDLGVYLVERFGGPQVARELTKAFVIDVGRTSQAPYSALQAKRYHNDPAILTLQDWLDSHFQHPVTLDTLCDISGLTQRSLIRRFKAATGDSPTTYLQLLRIEAARQRLETSLLSVEQITHAAGYEDVSSFSRLFKKHTGLSPGAYRARFRR